MTQNSKSGSDHNNSNSTSDFSENLSLDTSGEWLSMRKPSNSIPKTNKKDESERQRLMKVFTDHAFQFLACAKYVLDNPRLAFVDVPITNGMAYTGALPKPTIGAYIEMWTTSPYCARIGKDGLSLTWFISGSPLSGANACESVWEDGTCRKQSPNGRFIDVAMACGRASGKFQSLKREKGTIPYTLDEAAEWVENKLTPKTYRKAIENFIYWLHESQLNKAVEKANNSMERSEQEANAWKHLYVDSALRLKVDQVRTLVADYRKLEQTTNNQIELLNRANDELKARFSRWLRGKKEYNTPFHRNNKAIEKLKQQLRQAEYDARKQLFPDSALGDLQGINSIHYEVEKLVTMESLSKFLEQEDKCHSTQLTGD